MNCTTGLGPLMFAVDILGTEEVACKLLVSSKLSTGSNLEKYQNEICQIAKTYGKQGYDAVRDAFCRTASFETLQTAITVERQLEEIARQASHQTKFVAAVGCVCFTIAAIVAHKNEYPRVRNVFAAFSGFLGSRLLYD